MTQGTTSKSKRVEILKIPKNITELILHDTRNTIIKMQSLILYHIPLHYIILHYIVLYYDTHTHTRAHTNTQITYVSFVIVTSVFTYLD